LINMAFTMACPNFKKGLKMVSGHLGVKYMRTSPY
jgi:serine protease inhibitor ecotin